MLVAQKNAARSILENWCARSDAEVNDVRRRLVPYISVAHVCRDAVGAARHLSSNLADVNELGRARRGRVGARSERCKVARVRMNGETHRNRLMWTLEVAEGDSIRSAVRAFLCAHLDVLCFENDVNETILRNDRITHSSCGVQVVIGAP